MSRWKRYWERRQQRRKALQLLNLSGAIRSADVEPRYLGPERMIGRARHEGAGAAQGTSGLIWTMELTQLWRTYARTRGVTHTMGANERRAA